MKINIDGRDYAHLKALTYAPQLDVTNDTVPILEFEADSIDVGDHAPGTAALLKDDLDQIWAQFAIAETKRLDRWTLRIRAQSAVAALDRRTMPAKIYHYELLSAALNDIFSGSAGYTMSTELLTKTVYGYAPQQTARERLQWVLTAVGAYVRQTNAVIPEILPTPAPSEIALSIPISDVYWRPEIETVEKEEEIYTDAYEIMAALDGWKAPKMLTVDDVSYLLLSRRYWLKSRADLALLGSQNPVAMGVTLISPDNVADVLTAIYPYSFGGRIVEADVINNNAYIPGDVVSVPTTEDGDRVTGVVESASFSFGLQAKSRLRVREIWSDGAQHTPFKLTVERVFPGDSETPARSLGSEIYNVPSGMRFLSLTPFYYEPFFVMRPDTLLIGTTDMPASDTTQTAYYAKALWYDQGGLTLQSVSSFEGFQFFTNSAWAYRKTINVQKDGVDTVRQNVVCFTLKQAQDSPHSRKVAWWPKDYVDTISQITYQQDLVFLEGEVSCVFRTVDKLKIPLSGGGLSEWVAIEEVPNA